jgi:hypothetical protein
MDAERLSSKQQMFLRFFFESWNASEAAKKAGYAKPHNVSGAKLLNNPQITAAVREKLALEGLDSNFVRARLKMIASASIGDFIDVDSHSGQVSFNYEKAKRLGVDRFAKKVSIRDGKIVTIEMVDPLHALAILARLLGLFDSAPVDHASDGVIRWFRSGGDIKNFTGRA